MMETVTPPSGKVLVVDDVEFSRRLIALALKKDRVWSRGEGDAAGAIRALREDTFDAVLLDLDLGDGSSGYEVLAEMRRRPEWRDIPVILVTGTACTPAAIAEGLHAGAQDFVTKPFEPTVLRARVAAAVRSRRVVAALRADIDRAHANAELDKADRAEATAVQRSALPQLPVRQGGIHVTGEIIPAEDVSGDILDVAVDEAGRVTMVLIDCAGHGIAAGLVASAARLTARRGLTRGKPLLEVAQGIETALREHQGVLQGSAATGLVRFDERAETVEVMNAALPPIVSAGSTGMHIYESTGAPLGLARGILPELRRAPLERGLLWMMASDGLTDGRLDEDPAVSLAERLGLGRFGLQLAMARPADLKAMMWEVMGYRDSPEDDATLVFGGIEPEGEE